MKELNRRAFLTLTGAALAMMALAACGADDAPAAPAAPSTTDEAKVLTALNLYRAKAGISSPLTLDSGLKPATDAVLKFTDKTQNPEDVSAEYMKAVNGYVGACPIGLTPNTETLVYSPKYACMDSVEQMVEYLSGQTDKAGLEQLKSPDFKLVNIQTFKYGGVTYWIAVVAKSKVTT